MRWILAAVIIGSGGLLGWFMVSSPAHCGVRAAFPCSDESDTQQNSCDGQGSNAPRCSAQAPDKGRVGAEAEAEAISHPFSRAKGATMVLRRRSVVGVVPRLGRHVEFVFKRTWINEGRFGECVIKGKATCPGGHEEASDVALWLTEPVVSEVQIGFEDGRLVVSPDPQRDERLVRELPHLARQILSFTRGWPAGKHVNGDKLSVAGQDYELVLGEGGEGALLAVDCIDSGAKAGPSYPAESGTLSEVTWRVDAGGSMIRRTMARRDLERGIDRKSLLELHFSGK